LAQDGKVPLALAAVDPVALSERVTRETAAHPKSAGVELAVEGAARPLWADESLLERALRNLVGNAVDACAGQAQRGKVAVRLRDEDRELVIEVADTGPGIAPERLAEILGTDFKSTKHSTGVGLGVATTRHIALQHGGVLEAHSTPGAGSTFRLRLPRRAEADVTAEDAIAAPT
jgi:signal transduction histidine kinase